ncbi:PepSY domain-containing protein [Streptomyces sp. NPDC057638]|uniref:PepSY domain-containing protein n=1 Tax=Streptomyces sp. NPDC057638 TaxID=3346190 RepID=UPI0036AF6D12
MKRKMIVAAAVAAALVGGGAVTAVAASGDDTPPASRITSAQAVDAALKKAAGTVESVDRDDDGAGHWEVDIRAKDGLEREVRVDAGSGEVLKVTTDDDTDDRDDRDDDRAGDRDDADDRDDTDDRDGDRADDADDRAEREAAASAAVNAQRAEAAALKLQPGTVTEVEFDDGRWEVEVRAEDGAEHDVRVDAKTAKATLSQDD